MTAWTKHAGRWYLIGAPEFVVAWEGQDGRFHWSVGTLQSSATTTIGSDAAAKAGSMQSGSLYQGGLEAAKARAIAVMTQRHEEAKAALRLITERLGRA